MKTGEVDVTRGRQLSVESRIPISVCVSTPEYTCTWSAVTEQTRSWLGMGEGMWAATFSDLMFEVRRTITVVIIQNCC